MEVSKLIEIIEGSNLAISANGTMFRTDRQSLLSTILFKWFEERVEYKTLIKKKAYTAGNKADGEKYHMMQYTMKILLNLSTYGALAVPSFRWGSIILSEAITLSGQRIIQESALTANRHMNEVILKGNKTL